MLIYEILANAETSISEHTAKRSAWRKEAAKLKRLRRGRGEKLQAGIMRAGD